MAERRLFPVHKLGKGDGLREALATASGATITVLDLEDVAIDRRIEDALGGSLLPWQLRDLAKAAGGIGRFTVPSTEQAVVLEREHAELDAVMGAGGNPWLKRTKQWNLTRQLEIQRTSPDLAARLKKEAEDELALYEKALREKDEAVKAAYRGDGRYFNTGDKDTDARRQDRLG